MSFSEEEKAFIREAVLQLEYPSLLVRITDLIGKPVEVGMRVLPGKAKELVEAASRQAIEGALKAALSTLRGIPPPAEFNDAVRESTTTGGLHRAAAGVTGFVGGLFGLPAVLAELPLTTTVMLRSIAATAAAFGEDLEERDVQLECLALFSLGAPSPADDEMESAYYTARLAIGQMVSKAAAFTVGKSALEIVRSVERKAAPALVELIVRVASRFQVVVGEKAMGQLVPGVGAAAGALLNVAFSEHFNSIARYHFGLKRLEREKGAAAVQALYREIHEELKRGKG